MYLSSGQEVQFIENLSNGQVLVQELIEVDGDTMIGNTIIVDKVYEEPPVKKFNQQIVKLNKEIAELEQAKYNLEDQIRSVEKSAKETQRKYARYDALKKLNDFIDGKITHFLFTDHSPEIEEFNTAIISDVRYDSRLKLLSLFGKSNGDLGWRINSYSDGSGSWNTVVPCTSYEEARTLGQELVDKHVREDKIPSSYVVDFAREHNLTINETYVQAVKAKERESKEYRIKGVREELARLEKELEKI